MELRASERGNTLLIATVLILGLTVLSLGVAKVLQRQARDSADIRLGGYPATQALYAAEMGVNATMYAFNARTNRTAAPALPAASSSTATWPYTPTFMATTSYSFEVQSVSATAGATPVHRYRAIGQAGPLGGPMVTRRILFDVASRSAAHRSWELERYEQE